jgi:hypothetical protein
MSTHLGYDVFIAELAWFRAWPQDMIDNASYQTTKLAMPVLAVGAAGSLGDFVSANARERISYAKISIASVSSLLAEQMTRGLHAAIPP